MTVVSMNDFRPPPRNDGVPWRYMEIEESATGTDPGTLIDTKDLSLAPYTIDTDPTNPQARDWTTSSATLPKGTGWYRVRFRDGVGNYSDYSNWILDALVGWLPTLREVAVHIRARTVERNTNNWAGTFTDKTRPSDDQAWEAIQLAEGDVLRDTGKLDATWLSDEGSNAVRALIALRAAMIIERSYFPEQVGTAKSPYEALERDWNASLPKVVAAVAEDKAGDIEPGDGAGGGVAPTSGSDLILDAGTRLYLASGGFVGDADAQYTFPDDAPGGTITGDTKF